MGRLCLLRLDLDVEEDAGEAYAALADVGNGPGDEPDFAIRLSAPRARAGDGSGRLGRGGHSAP